MTKATWFTEFTFTPTQSERFWNRVEKTDECWIWRGPTSSVTGYGVFAVTGSSLGAHRAAYLDARGPIDLGLVLDHLCRNKRCVNPEHLEPVTPRENTLRSPIVCPPACSKGHPFTPENTRMYMSGNGTRTRHCLTCGRERAKRSMAAKRRRDGAVPWAERTHCGRGHELTPENTYVPPSKPNRRECRACKALTKAEREG
jgi:hypothetical protein